MAEPSLQLGNGNWAGKSGNLLGYHKVDNNFYADELTFTRASTGTIVNAEGLIESVASGIPRVDYLNNSNGSLLLEPQRTNLITYSEDFSQSYWGKLGLSVASAPSVTSNTSISPSGEQNASRVIFDLNGGTTASDRSIIRVSESTASARVFSIYIKSFDGTDQQISLHSGSEGSPFTVTSEWTRYTFSISSGVTFVGFGLNGTNGVDVSDILFYGAQLEQGSYSTSYIPTSGTSTTRLADTSSTTGLSSVIGQTEGTVFIECKVNGEDNPTGNIFNTKKQTSNAISIIRTKSNKKISVRLYKSSIESVLTSTSSINLNEIVKIGFKYKSGDTKLFINGAVESSFLSAFSFNGVLQDLFLSDVTSYFADHESVSFNSVMVFPSALTDTELATLTTI
jgi:hypothetical protein